MLNRVTIMGRIVNDIELKQTPSGVSVATIRIACERDIKDKDGNKQTDFFDVVAWRSMADFLSRYFSKGRMVILEGRMQNREWTDKNGNKRVSTEIVADSAYFGDSKTQDSRRGDLEQKVEAFAEIAEEDGELPF